MLFNSFGYILVFLPLVVIAIFTVKRVMSGTAAQICILAFSLVFYCWVKPSNIFYLAASILFNWWISQRIKAAGEPGNKRWLQSGLALNAAYLAAFKYVNFILGNLPFMRGYEHLIPDLEFPVGISFFTLAQVMYLVDCYEGLMEPSSLLDHATFVSFFPYITSGPIARAKRIVHQFANYGEDNSKDGDRVARGAYLFAIGLFKKTVFAEAFSHVANYGFDTATNCSAVEVILFAAAYGLQVYFDFSGYSDMAIGASEMLGIEIPRNFDAPFQSTSIIEFWQRWHISLTSFITTYLYTPILRSFRRTTLWAAAFATLTAMGISGLWHGPSWTFIIWGILHGTGLSINQTWRRKKMPKLPAWLSWLATFSLVDIAFIFFRSSTVGAALKLLGDLFSLRHPLDVTNLVAMHTTVSLPIYGLPLVLGIIVAFVGKSSEQSAREFSPTLWSAPLTAVAMLVAFLYMNSQVVASFIYRRF